MKTLAKLVSMACSLALPLVLSASTWYVDDDNYNEAYSDAAAYIAAGFDGTTEAKAFGTIQAAVDAETTLAGDTIIVLPGVYDKGGRVLTWNSGASSAGSCRVVVEKNNLTIRSREGGAKGAAETHIVGQKAATDSGNGDGAIRCFGLYRQYGVQLRGFTLRDGATLSSGGDYDKHGGGVLVVVASGDYPVYIVDCVITNCSGRLSVARSGTVCRTFIADNQSQSDGAIGSASQFYGCIFTRNYGSSASVLGASAKAVHCTIVGNSTKWAATSTCSIYNSIVSLSYNKNFTEFSGTPANSYGNVTETANGNYQTIAPLLDDYKIISGAVAETAGDGQYTSASMFNDINNNKFPSDVVNRDFFGRQIASDLSGAVMAGAVAETAVPDGGAIAFSSLDWATKRVDVNGTASCKDGIYAFPTNYPVQWRVKPVLASGDFFGWSTDAAHGYAHFADTNDIAYLMPPPSMDVVETNSLLTAATPVWLSPTGDDTTGDGSFENPYQTLAKGVAARTGNRLIYCKRGTYNRGEDASFGGRTNRVVLNERPARFVAVDGKDVTFIEGRASDTVVADSAQQGCGPDAIAGVYVNGTPRVCFLGFTFRNCHTDYDKASVVAGQGAAVRASQQTVSLIDCDIVNCSAGRYVSANAKLIGCHVKNNSTSGALCNGLAFGCEFANNTCAAAGGGTAYNCTYLCDSPFLYNYACIGVNGNGVPSGASYAGSIFYNYASYAGSGYTTVDPLMVCSTDGRVSSRSPAYTCGVKPDASSAVSGADYYKVADCALDGVPLTIANDGRPMAGAYQRGVDSAVTVKASNGGLSTSLGTRELALGETLEISAGNPGSRPCFGYAVNGVTNFFDETPSRTITSADATAAGAMIVEALYAPHWYVNADPAVGDDDNTGFTPNTAKRTLAAAYSVADLADGDTVHAAAGMYTNGTMFVDEQTIPSRVVVRANTMLVADDGPTNTFIVGGMATGTTDGDDTRNCGEGAVRCAYLRANATIRGFTLTGGRTRCRAGQHYSVDDSGGGICGVNASTSVGENLIISNNASFRGGAVRYATLRKCRIYDNLGYYNGAIGGEGYFFGCVADGNIGGDQVYGYKAIADCTFGENNKTRDGSLATAPGTAGSSSYVSNTLTRCVANASGNYTRTFCVDVTGGNAPEGLLVVDVSNLRLDENLRPVVGENAAIDQAVGPVANGPYPDLDALGGQRVYNGARDCGALEADWRVRYARDICSRLNVQSADPQVSEQHDLSVRVNEGSSLNATLQRKSESTYKAKFVFRVSSGGLAKLAVGGVETVLEGGTHDIPLSVGDVPLQICVTAISGSVDILRATPQIGCIISVF